MFIVFDRGFQVVHVLKMRVVHFLVAKLVQRGVGQDALEQHGLLVGRSVGVVGAQSDHCVLHDVQGRVIVTDGIGRALERSALHAAQELIELVGG